MRQSFCHREPRSASSRSGLFCNRVCALVLGAFMMTAALGLQGCGSSSPRFRSGDHSGRKSSERTASVRFATREEAEESRENDKQPDAKEIESVVSGTRDFRKEKNTAITPLDQSKMMRAISRYMGVPYVYGGSTKEGLDCSAYTMLVYKESISKELPRSAQEQSKIGTSVRLQDLKFGDLIFFNTTGKPGSHVGIYLGDDLFAHASVTLGVTISSLESSYYKNRYEGARRIVINSN